MRSIQKLTLIASAILLCAAVGISFAQTSTPPPPPDPAVVDQVYKMIDANHDGVRKSGILLVPERLDARGQSVVFL